MKNSTDAMKDARVIDYVHMVMLPWLYFCLPKLVVLFLQCTAKTNNIYVNCRFLFNIV